MNYAFVVFLVIFALLAYGDIRYHWIHPVGLLVLTGIIIFMQFMAIKTGENSIEEIRNRWIIAIGIWIILQIVYRFSREQIGQGDIRMIGVLALQMSVFKLLSVLLAAFCFCAVWGIVQVSRKKYRAEKGIAFAPFLFAAVVIMTIRMQCN